MIKVITVNTISYEMNGNCVSRTGHLIECTGETALFLEYSSKHTKPESNGRETLDNRKLRDTLQNNWPAIFESLKIMNVMEDYSRTLQKGTNKTWQLKAISDALVLRTDQTCIGPRIRWWLTLTWMVFSRFWWLHCGYDVRCPGL